MSRSFMAAFSAFAIKSAGYKKKVGDPVRRDRYIEKLRVNNRKAFNAPPFPYKCRPEKTDFGGVELFTFNKGADRKIIYLHGGAYCEQPLLPHFMFCDKIASSTDSEIILPIYKKSPEHKFTETYDFLENYYKLLLEKTTPESILFMGDSSGGGLALGFCEYLNESKLPMPSKLILLSPWVDISMDTPFEPEVEKHDPSLERAFLRQCGLNWAGETDVHDYRLSPIYYDKLGELPPMTVYFGTYEAFITDARKFRDRCLSLSARLDYREYAEMNHVFAIYPIPEAKRTQREIADIITAK